MILSILTILFYAILLAVVIKIAFVAAARLGFAVGGQIENLIWLAYAIIVLIWIVRMLLISGGIPSLP